MNNRVFIYVAAAVLVGIAALSIYAISGGFDVIGQRAVPAFEAMLEELPEEADLDEAADSWRLISPDGRIRFSWSRDFGGAALRDLAFEFESGPFVDAGLSLELLPEGMVQGEKIVVGTRLEKGGPEYDGDATPASTFAEIVRLNRGSIKYHADMDHFGISLGGGNMFEWAKDMGSNDKDIVFVLNPEPFIEAGADPEAIEGWIFGKVKVMDAKGRMIEADKLLKPYNLDERE